MKRIFLAFTVLFAIACAPIVSYGSDDGVTKKIELVAAFDFSAEQGVEVSAVEIVPFDLVNIHNEGLLPVPACWAEREFRLPSEDNHMHNKILKQSTELANSLRSLNLSGEFIGNYKFCIC